MTKTSNVYRQLQEHLDKMPVGYPATKSGVEINLLKRIFTPEQAKISLHLDYKYRTIDQIFQTAKAEVTSIEKLNHVLDEIVSNGGISRRERGGEVEYATIPPILWGMYEHQLKRLSPEFLSDMGQYLIEELGFELATTTLPKTRVIPIEKSLEIQHRIATYDELRTIIERAGEHITVQECFCKKVNDLQNKSCQATDRREVCMSFGDLADLYAKEGWGRKVNQKEALEIARKNEEEGLVLQSANEQEPTFLCACCTDCCGVLGMIKNFPKPAEVVGSNYFCQVDSKLCIGCNVCVRRCRMGATKVEDKLSTVELKKCIGCGLCVPTCPEKARHLVQKDKEVIPPKTVEDFYEAIMAPKRTFKGKTRNYLFKTFLRVVSRFTR